VPTEDKPANENEEEEAPPPAVEHYGKVSHDSDEQVQQSETAQDAAGENTENDREEVGRTLM